MSWFFVVSLFVLSFLNAGLFDSLDRQTVGNADGCVDLNANQALCERAGACIWDEGGSPSKCYQDPCFNRTFSTTTACPTISGRPCEHVLKRKADDSADTASHFCITQSRTAEFTTRDKICSLEWGGYKFVELAACETLSTDGYGCGPVDPIQGAKDSHYVCKVGAPVTDPCKKITDAELCTYVGDCLYKDGICVTDPCWEKTYVSTDGCKAIDGATCEKHVLNPTGTPETGYCKTPTHDLHSPCNVGTATNIVSKQGVCTWAATGIPDDCNKVATINNYDDGTLYVCNPTGEEFDLGAAMSLKPLVAALTSLLLLIVML